MARRRKGEAKASPKSQPAPSAVRKSTRQRAKKQLEEQKVNGDVSTNICNSEDCKDPNEDSQEPIKKVNAVPKKSGRYKNIVDKTKPAAESGNSQQGESDNSQNDQGAVLETIEEEQITATENTLSEEVVWSEDVIEETIICEEMEVETEMNDGCSIAQDGSVVVEQVILMNDPNFEEKDVVEYTVIQSEDGTESMIVSSDNVDNVETLNEIYRTSNNCQTIEKGLSVLHVSETKISESVEESKSETVIDANKTLKPSLCDSDICDTVKVDPNIPQKECRALRSVTKGVKITRTKNLISTSDKNVKNESDNRKKKTETVSKKVSSVEDKTLSTGSKEKLIKPRKAYASSNVTEQNNTQHLTDIIQNSVTLAQEDDNSSSMSDKLEHQEISDASTSDSLKDIKTVNNSTIFEQKSISSTTDSKIEVTNRLISKSKNLLFGNEEYFRDSEMDGKIDSEDTKISSSSENSNDTLLSLNSCKISDSNVDNKNTLNQSSETEKKPGFRSRSGSTDTTGSESGSNSSGVRRSNRIRTIGLMKQRSRGRGLVTKPSVDPTKTVVHQDRDKLISNTPPILDKDSNQNKDVLETILETQSDKENASNKTITAQDVLTPLVSATGTTGYDSDSNKPVKVKSRWRRSSELEMSNSGSWSASRPTIGFPNPAVTGAPVGVVTNTLNDLNNKLPPLPVGIPQESKKETDIQDSVSIVFSQNNLDLQGSSDNLTITNSLTNMSSPFIPRTVGARISLPMVSVVTDREMEERLSQFEHLKENLYLTERITNKETKRMVCDCFLTDEEIQRGELGCGEDCLNRLLMIECGSRCVVGDRCTNKRFQNCEYANLEVFRTEKKGFGLRATTDLNAGDFIMEYVGEVVDPKDFRKRAKEYSKDKNRHYYFMALKSDQIIDATMKGNISRFINHSCDPNAETQKWTVNGELRIGFFNKKFVAAGDEITFDYHFQRYGKEAQKCFCEATNCRGWIGDNPEDSKNKSSYADEMEDTESSSESDIEDVEDKEEDIEKTEKPVKPIRRRRRRKRVEKQVTEHMEDEDLEEQIDKLCASGLKNRAHTLTLSRLMVRSREIQHRTRLLKVIQSGEQACRRLFLDYHGLRLMWSYMMDVAGSSTDEAQQFRLEILKTLSTLPIPNRTMLIDSKVLSLIEKWSKQLYHSSGESPEDEQSKLKSSNEENDMDISEKPNIENLDETNIAKKGVDSEMKPEVKVEVLDSLLIPELANNLLVSWSNLKEVFRIPKKERIEQMKEHEREADRGYKEDVEKEARESNTYERYRSDRYSRNELEKRPDRRRGRDSPDFEHNRAKDKRTIEERPNLVQVPRMSKFERRQLFAMKVAKEEEERQRRQQEDSWQQHQTQCIALGLDPYTTATFDPQSGYPLFFNPQLSQWQPYPIQEGTDLGQQVTPAYMAPGGPVAVSPATAIVGTPQPPLYPIGQPPPFVPPLASLGPGNILPMPNGTTSLHYVEKLPESESEPMSVGLADPEPEVEASGAPPPPLDLPPKWKWARDKRGRVYYYHIKERVSQWLPPPPDHIAVQPDSSTTSESSEESTSSNEDEDEIDEQLDQSTEGMEIDVSEAATVTVQPEVKKRRDGLVQERIISPRREEDRVDHKKYKEIKEKLRRQKERAKLKEHFEKLKKHRRSKSKSHTKHTTSKFQPITSDMSPTTERRIKDTFRINMANVMVHFLNPYRKNDCKQGRITNTDDFKHLARKLTHFVLAKELKHCKSVDELECNDNVKHKAKDFVRKYMSKFGAVYQKGTDED